MNSTGQNLDWQLLALLPGKGEIPAASRSHLFRYTNEVESEEILSIFKKFEDFVSHEEENPFTSLRPTQICSLWDSFGQIERDSYLKFSSHLLEGYYADPLVLKGFGLRHIPLFPSGTRIQESDLSMLEQVFSRGPIYKT